MQKQVYEYISKKMNDPITERKKCSISGKEFPIYNSDQRFYHKISPVFDGKRYTIPTPQLCPEERERRRLMFRNERKLYRIICALTGKSIIGIYSPDSPYTIYDKDIWRSDQWDAMGYGIDFDFSKTFTEQFTTLVEKVPRPNVYGTHNENCDYTNHCNGSKDCYLCADLVNSRDCLYSHTSIDSDTNVDCILATYSNNVYRTVDSGHIYHSQYILESDHCSYSYFLYGCTNCQHCFACHNLQHQEYCIFNKQYTKEEYHKKLKELLQKPPNTYIDFICSNSIKENVRQENSQNAFGHQIYNSKNIVDSFTIYDAEDIKYSQVCGFFKDCYDCLESGLGNTNLLYECHAVIESNSCARMSISYRNQYSYYLDNCYDNKNCFGCVGIRNKEYCIFNKQYSKYEYDRLVPKIIEHMIETGERGEFFDPTLSPFGYNESVAMEHFPLSHNEAKQRGYNRLQKEYSINITGNTKTVLGSTLPQSIDKIKNDILDYIIICETSGKPFRVIQKELQFYRQHNISLPRKHPDIRYQQRLLHKPNRRLYLRKSDKSGKEMLSVYPENTPFPVYNQQEYQQEFYS